MVRLVDLDPMAVLAGDTPRLLDEWQLAPDIWNYARHEIDDRQTKGQFIFSGSASPPPDRARHSGAGRISRLRMRTMSLAERGASSEQVSLESLHRGQDRIVAHSELTYAALAEQAVRGGWPGLLDMPTTQAARFNASYVQDIARAENAMPAGVAHHPARMARLIGALARATSQSATLRTLAMDASGAEPCITAETTRTYMDSLTGIFCLEELPAWSVKLRSRSRLRTPSKIHLADPALAVAALGATPERLAHDPEFFGQVFESMVVHDLRAYAQANDGRLYHYRDNTGLEVDAIIEYSWREWAAIEVKLGHKEVELAERNLLRLRDERIDTEVVGQPTFLAVITGTEYGYTLPSGVHVIPLATLTV